jgi:CheY-like chemotaxis protein
MRRYLIVDDNVEFAENVAEILRDEGCEVSVASSGAAALETLKRGHYDALITDMKMPQMSGGQLLRQVRKLDPGLPAVLLTAFTTDAELNAAEREGLLAVLPKPVPIAQLLMLLKVARREGLVALVEDDAALAENLCELMRERGFTVVAAHDAGEAERLTGLKPFAALVDLRVPGASPGEVLLQLSSRFPGMPLLVISGYPEQMPRLSNATLFAKPFDTQRVVEALERLHGQGSAGAARSL